VLSASGISDVVRLTGCVQLITDGVPKGTGTLFQKSVFEALFNNLHMLQKWKHNVATIMFLKQCDQSLSSLCFIFTRASKLHLISSLSGGQDGRNPG
jgi:hypothetical protein